MLQLRCTGEQTAGLRRRLASRGPRNSSSSSSSSSSTAPLEPRWSNEGATSTNRISNTRRKVFKKSTKHMVSSGTAMLLAQGTCVQRLENGQPEAVPPRRVEDRVRLHERLEESDDQ
jgi:hypothetical protein